VCIGHAVYPIAIGLAIRNNTLWSDVTGTLRDLPFRVVFDHPELEDRPGLLERIERAVPDVVLFECTNKTDTLEELVSAIRATAPSPLVIALHASPELEGVVTALRAGVIEFLYPPIRENLHKALDRAQRLVNRRPPGKVFGFLSAKGGCGATTLACHTAVAIADRARRLDKGTVLIDLDLNTGMVRFLMRTSSPYSVLDAASNLQRLDIGYWKALTSNDAPGLDVIAAPADLVSKHQLNREQIQHVLSFSRCYYDWTVVDLGRGLGLMTMSVLEAIDELFLVTTAEVPALHLTKKIIEVLKGAGFGEKKIRLIANRSHTISASASRELESLIGLPLFANLPNDYSRLFRSYSECKLLAKGGALAVELDRLAGRMVGEEVRQPERSKGWAGGLPWFGRKADNLT
jgi:pilus assembly protein CpaE